MTSLEQDVSTDTDPVDPVGPAGPVETQPGSDGGALPPAGDDGRGGGGGGRRWWRRRRPIDKGLLLVSLVIGFGLFLFIRGLSAGITGDDRVQLPEQVESVEPVPEAVQVPNQTRVFVDLETGYTGVLVIDGVEIETVSIRDIAEEQAVGPGEQLDLPPVTVFEGGNNTLTFIPNDDAPITEFTTGEHRVQVIFWEEEVGRQRAKSFSWTFNVV